MNKGKFKEVLHNTKSKLVLLKTKLLEQWNKLTPMHKKIFSGCAVFLVIFILLMMLLGHFMNRPLPHRNPIGVVKEQSVSNETPATKTQYSETKSNIVDLAPKPKKIELSADMQAKVEALEKKNKQLMAQLDKNKDGTATKEDIKNLMDQIKDQNSNLQQMINNNANAISGQIIQLSNQFDQLKTDIKKTIDDNPITVANDDLTVASIIWVNGQQLVNVHDNAIDSNVTMNIGQTYKNWKLVSIDGNNCVVLQNNVGVNKQCI